MDSGFFVAPTLIANATNQMTAVREEIFGPVVVVLPYDTLDEAFDILNGVDYGLTSALFSERNDVVQRFIDESESGMIHVNHGTIPDNHMPFGGVKNSGYGRFGGMAGVREFTDLRWITVQTTPRHYPF